MKIYATEKAKGKTFRGENLEPGEPFEADDEAAIRLIGRGFATFNLEDQKPVEAEKPVETEKPAKQPKEKEKAGN